MQTRINPNLWRSFAVRRIPLHLFSVNSLVNPSFHSFYCIFPNVMHSLPKASLLILAALCVLEAAPNSPKTVDKHPVVPLPGIMTFQVKIDMPNEKFRNAVLRSLAGTCHPIFVDQEAKKFSVDWTQCNVVDVADLEHITIDIQNDLDPKPEENDLDPKPEGHVDPVHSVKLPKEDFRKFFAGGDAQIVIKPAHGKPTGLIDYKITYLNGLPGTLKFSVDHSQLGKENAFDFMTIAAKQKKIPCTFTMISENPLEFSVNWADSKCVEKLKDMDDVQIQFKFKDGDEQVSLYKYPPMLRHLYAGGEAKITLYTEYKDRPKLEYVKYPSGENVPQPGIMFFDVEMESKIERFDSADISECGTLIKGEGSKFIVDWSRCDVIDEDDLQKFQLKLKSIKDPKKLGQVNPVYGIYFEKFSREKLKQLFDGGKGKIVVHEDAFITPELTVLSGPKSVETKNAGTITFSVDFKQLAEGMQDFHLKRFQTMHRLFDECKAEIHSNGENTVKFSVNWAECQREVLGHYNLLDVKFRLDFSHGKPRFIELANYSHSLLKHLYNGGEAEIVMHQNEKQKPDLTYVKYPTGMSVPQLKLLTINVELENKLERFKKALIGIKPGTCKTLKGDGPTFVVDWSQCEVVEAEDLQHFEILIEGFLNPKLEGKPNPEHYLYFETFSKETLNQLFNGGEAKMLIRQESGAKHELTYLNGPKSVDETIKAGTVTFTMDYADAVKDTNGVHVKSVQTLHRLLGGCKTEMHDSTKEFTVKFSFNWAECGRKVLGEYNLLDIKFRVDFTNGKERLIKLANYSNSLLKHLYAGGEAHIVMYKEQMPATKKTSITYVKYSNGSDVPLPKTLTINVQIENKKESFNKVEILKPNGEIIDIGKNTKLSMDWTDYDYGMVEAEDLRHFWLYIHGVTDFGAEPKPDDYVQPVHAIGFVDLSKEELGHLFVGGEAKLLIRDTENDPKPTLFLNMDKSDETVPKSTTKSKHPGPLHFNINYDKLGPNIHFKSVRVLRYWFMTVCETEIGKHSEKQQVKFTVKDWTKCAPNIGDMKSLYFEIKFTKKEGEEKKEIVHKSYFDTYPSTLLEHFYVGGEAYLEVYGFDERKSVVTYVKHPSEKTVERPGILSINVWYENKNELHFHSADIVVPEGLARTADNGKKTFYANWDRLQLVNEEDLRNFRINVHSLLANKPYTLIHPMHTIRFNHFTTQQLKRFYDGGNAMIFIRGNRLPELDFLPRSAGLTASGIPHPRTVTFHLKFANKKQTLIKAQVHSQFGFFEAENGYGPDPSFKVDWSKTGIVFEEEIGKTTIYIIGKVKQSVKTVLKKIIQHEPNTFVYKIALSELPEEMRKQLYAGGKAKITFRDHQADEGIIVIKPEDITILNSPRGSVASTSGGHR